MLKARPALAAAAVAAVCAVTAAAVGSSAVASGDSRGGRLVLRERLSSYQEAPQTLSTFRPESPFSIASSSRRFQG